MNESLNTISKDIESATINEKSIYPELNPLNNGSSSLKSFGESNSNEEIKSSSGKVLPPPPLPPRIPSKCPPVPPRPSLPAPQLPAKNTTLPTTVKMNTTEKTAETIKKECSEPDENQNNINNITNDKIKIETIKRNKKKPNRMSELEARKILG